MSEEMRERAVAKIRANLPIPSPDGPTLLPCQSETINRFDDEGVAKGAVEMIASRYQFLHQLRHLGLMFPKTFIEFTKEDMIQFFNKPVRRANGITRKMAHNTKRGKTRIVKCFFRWLYDLPERTYPHCIAWIGKPGKAESSITEADLLTQDEILALLRASCPQSRARIGVHFDTAGRNHEIHGLTKRDVEKVSFGYRITLRGRPGSKTKGGSRTVPMVTHVKYLTGWINEHPTWETEDNPTLWINTRDNGPLIDEAAWGKKLNRIARWAGVSKRVYPHNFRHSKLTDCARMRMPEYTMRKFAGWSPTSNMPATYVHLSGVDMINEALRAAGKEVPEARPMFADIVTVCPHCEEENDLHSTYCYSCSASLDGKKYVREETRKMAELLNDNEEMRKQLIDLLQQSPS